VVLVDEAAEYTLAEDLTAAVVKDLWWLRQCFGWLLVAGLVWAMVVVVALVLGENTVGVGVPEVGRWG
jgi:hypothetical protein